MIDSLIIVTSDHASAVVYSGFATPKDYSILGLDKYVSNVDKRPYQLLTYASGLGYEYYNESIARSDHRSSFHKATVPSTWANHAGDDVPLYAVGSLANLLFSGSMDQTYVPHAIAFAMCLFNYQDRCPTPTQVELPRTKKPSTIHLLKQKLQQEIFQAKQHESEKVDEPAATTFNTTDVELISTSDLVGNFTEESSDDGCKLSLNLILSLFLIMLINFFK